MSIGPCAYPGCRDVNGDPELTSDGMCHPCQRRFRRLLSWLVLDWVHLSQHLPTPQSRNRVRTKTQQVYGHPAEWASDTATDIADTLSGWHTNLAEHLSQRAPRPHLADQVRVRAAWDFLECRIDRLAETEFAFDCATEIKDLHARVRSTLGFTRPRQLLTTPCPNCELRTLFRSIDAHRDSIDCESCGHDVQEQHYPFFTRLVLDSIIAENTPQTVG